LIVGDPNDPETSLGALISRTHFEKVTGYIQYAKEQGYKIHCGGGEVKMSGRLEKVSFLGGIPYLNWQKEFLGFVRHELKC
jgi:acyl-CoA reductase-like NAD-dependent aldehyde dehydrogenase